jgi:hypothetical protein
MSALVAGTVTPHTARRTADGWEATWLPGHVLTRDQAAAAVTIAELAATTPQRVLDDPAAPVWARLNDWAAELRLTLTSETMHYLLTGTLPASGLRALALGRRCPPLTPEVKL